jgi:hypothetical protein
MDEKEDEKDVVRRQNLSLSRPGGWSPRTACASTAETAIIQISIIHHVS